MDALLSEINKKKAQIPSQKIIRRITPEPPESPVKRLKSATPVPTPTPATTNANTTTPATTTPTPATTTEEVVDIPEQEVIRRLRAHGEPIRLFAESDHARLLRLKRIQASQDRGQGQRNAYQAIVRNVDANLQAQLLKHAHSTTTDTTTTATDTASVLTGGDRKQAVFEKYATRFDEISSNLIDPALDDDTDMDQVSLSNQSSHNLTTLYTLLYVYYKKLLHDWELSLSTRSATTSATTDDDSTHNHPTSSGTTTRQDLITYRQTLDYMRPLFTALKSHSLPPSLLRHLTTITTHIHARHYILANDAYLRMSIGNAAWPIGVTGVHIHERRALDRIKEGQVAHVLNDERTRRWVQCVKRVITVAQKLYPPNDPTKIVH